MKIQYLIFSFCFLFTSCFDLDLEPNTTEKELLIEGKLTNAYSGEPLENVELVVEKRPHFFGGTFSTVARVQTDQEGCFRVKASIIGGIVYLVLPTSQKNLYEYQYKLNNVLVNNNFSESPTRNGIKLLVDEEHFLEMSLFPLAKFQVVINNIPPANNEDKLVIKTISTSLGSVCGSANPCIFEGPQNEINLFDKHPVKDKNFAYTRDQKVWIEYMIKNTLFEKEFECDPSDTTKILIEY